MKRTGVLDVQRRTIQAIVVATVLGTFGVASAAIITFTDRTSWTAAMAATDFTVDFETFSTDTSFAVEPLNVGPFTLSTIGTAPVGTNFVDVSPSPALPASFGNVAAVFYVENQVGGQLTADLVFASAVRGFFADFMYAGNTQQLGLNLSLSGGGSADLLVPGVGSGLEPFGFISTTDTIAAISLNNSVNDGFYIDNVSGAAQLGAVPEPASLSLLCLGLAGLGALRRSTRAKSGR